MFALRAEGVSVAVRLDAGAISGGVVSRLAVTGFLSVVVSAGDSVFGGIALEAKGR